MSIIDPNLKEWATDRQAEYIDAINTHGSMRKAATAMGVQKNAVNDSMNSLKRRAALGGYSPDHDMTRTVPAGYLVKGVSTYYNAEGKAAGQWVKSTLDQRQLEESIKAAVEALTQDVKRAKPVKGPAHTQDDLCTQYTFTDCHVGMRSWGEETGADWDLQIAENTLRQSFDHLIASSPPSYVGIVNQLGDFLHYDSLTPITPTSGHILDADGRYSKVITVAVRILRYIIDGALKKHEKVVVIMAEGNHDMSSAVWLRHLFSLLYENEPRVQVLNSELPYYVYQHGETMLAYHHGHMKKNDQLPQLFAAQYPKIWGNTTRRYCHTGHRHHVEEKEHSGMSVFQHSTMAARDAYAARGGWMSERQITSITYHKQFGQVARNTVVPEMLSIQTQDY
jgi:hypothetical protein